MEKIPTVEEYFKTEFEIWDAEYPELKTATHRKLIEFTKLHVKAALEKAAKSALVEAEPEQGKILYREEFEVGPLNGVSIDYVFSVYKNSILNAYPEKNIQ